MPLVSVNRPLLVGEEPFAAPDSVALRTELSAELSGRYGGGQGRPDPPDAPFDAFLVARDAAGRAVGCVALRGLEAGLFELKRMYVRPAVRGRRIADVLLAAAERRAAELGGRRMILQSGTAQPEALRVYARNGYEPIAPFGEWASSPLSRCFGRDLRCD